MNNYWYNQSNRHLCTDEDQKRPFLCETEASPIEFNCTEDCFKYLQEHDFDGKIITVLQHGKFR